MTAGKYTDKLKGYEFWSWEYQRRNERYISDYATIIDKYEKLEREYQNRLLNMAALRNANIELYVKYLDEPDLIDLGRGEIPGFGFYQTQEHVMDKEEALCGFTQEEKNELMRKYNEALRMARFNISIGFAEIHGRYPLDPVNGMVSDDMIKAITRGCFKAECDAGLHRRHCTGCNLLKMQGAVFLYIDTSVAIDILKATLEFEYYILKKDKYNADRAFERRAKLLHLPPGYKKSAPERRAIGLWLWDYIKYNKVKLGTAISKFKIKYGEEIASGLFGRQFMSDVKAFKDAYKMTAASISNARPSQVGGE